MKNYSMLDASNRLQTSVLETSRISVENPSKSVKRSNESQHYGGMRYANNRLRPQLKSIERQLYAKRQYGKMDILHNSEFGQRNFARLCDNSLIDATSFHQRQKFGVRIRNIKLQPIGQSRSVHDRQNDLKQITQNAYFNNGKVPLINIEIKQQGKESFFKPQALNEAKYEEELRRQLKQDTRVFYRQVIHSTHNDTGFVFLFKSFNISEQNAINEEPKVKTKRQKLMMPFSDMESLLQLPKLEDILHFLQNNLEIVEHGRIKLNFTAVNEIPKDKTSRIELPKKLIIENRHGSGYFLIEFPIVELYVPEYAYAQRVLTNSQQIFELLSTNFQNCTVFLERFDKSKFATFVEELRLRKVQAGVPDLKPIETANQAAQNIPTFESTEKTQKTVNESQDLKHFIEAPAPKSRKSTVQDTQQRSIEEEEKDIWGVIVVDFLVEDEGGVDVNVDQNNWHRKVLKQVVEMEAQPYVVTFCPSKIVVREKIRDRVVKSTFPSFEEFNSLLAYSLNHPLEYFCQTMIRVSAPGLDEMDLDYKDFQNKTEIKVDWPVLGDPDSALEVGEESITNGLFVTHRKDVIINNKHLIVSLCPPSLEIYDSIAHKQYVKEVTTDFINDMNKRSFYCRFRLI